MLTECKHLQVKTVQKLIQNKQHGEPNQKYRINTVRIYNKYNINVPFLYWSKMLVESCRSKICFYDFRL